jgi:hypothetical protein
LALKLKINVTAVEGLSKCKDSCVTILALDCQQRKLLEANLNTDQWDEYLNKEGLYSEHWLLVYEANKKGWLLPKNGKDYVSEDANFKFLKDSGISFYLNSRYWKILQMIESQNISLMDVYV